MTHRALALRIAFDGPTHTGVSPRRGPFSRSGPELCCDITRAPEGAPQHFPHQAGHDQIARKAALATRHQIGYADSFETQMAPGAVHLEVAVPNRGTSASEVVTVQDRTYVGVSLDPGGQPAFHVSTEPFRYA
jgi:hypothetical protein